MLNAIKNLTHVISEKMKKLQKKLQKVGPTKKIKTEMIKRKNKESINEINQAEKNLKKHKVSSQKKQKKKKIKVEIKIEIKPSKPLPPPVIKEEVKAAKRKRKNKININKINEKLKK